MGSQMSGFVVAVVIVPGTSAVPYIAVAVASFAAALRAAAAAAVGRMIGSSFEPSVAVVLTSPPVFVEPALTVAVAREKEGNKLYYSTPARLACLVSWSSRLEDSALHDYADSLKFVVPFVFVAATVVSAFEEHLFLEG